MKATDAVVSMSISPFVRTICVTILLSPKCESEFVLAGRDYATHLRSLQLLGRLSGSARGEDLVDYLCGFFGGLNLASFNARRDVYRGPARDTNIESEDC